MPLVAGCIVMCAMPVSCSQFRLPSCWKFYAKVTKADLLRAPSQLLQKKSHHGAHRANTLRCHRINRRVQVWKGLLSAAISGRIKDSMKLDSCWELSLYGCLRLCRAKFQTFPRPRSAWWKPMPLHQQQTLLAIHSTGPSSHLLLLLINEQ